MSSGRSGFHETSPLRWHDGIHHTTATTRLTNKKKGEPVAAPAESAAENFGPGFGYATAALDQAEGLMRDEDFEGAVSAADAALDELKALEAMQARTAVVRGKALLAQIADSEKVDANQAALQREAWEMFTMALQIEPENAEAKAEVDKLRPKEEKPSESGIRRPWEWPWADRTIRISRS